MTCVDIVMATFNGEKYLAEQIESLISQTHKNWRLLVSDDGSTDRSVEIVEKYAEYDSRIKIVNTMRQGGVIQNFSKGLSFSTSSYIMFCDQDDIWMSDKISDMLNKLKEIEIVRGNKTPILGFSDLTLVDGNGLIINKSYYEFNHLNPENNLDVRYLSWRSTVYGCTVIFNKALLEIAFPVPLNVPMHDQWFALNAAQFGSIFFHYKQSIYYRQHDNNVVGGAGSGFFGKLLSVKKLYKNTEKAAFKCLIQWNCLTTGYYKIFENSEVNISSAYSYLDKLKFIKLNVYPYWMENVSYSITFSLALLK